MFYLPTEIYILASDYAQQEEEQARGYNSENPLDKDEPCCVPPEVLKEWTDKYMAQSSSDLLLELLKTF